MVKQADVFSRIVARPYWREADARVVVSAWRQSGTSQAKFARKHGLQAKRLGRWVRRLASAPAWPAPPEPVRFHPVQLAGVGEASAAGEAKIEVVVAGAGHTIRLPRGFEPEDLRHVLAVLQDVA